MNKTGIGGAVVLGNKGVTPDQLEQAAMEQAAKVEAAIQDVLTHVAAMSDAEKLEWLTANLLELSRAQSVVEGMLRSLGMAMDGFRQWQHEMMNWQARIDSTLLFGKKQ